MFQNSNVGPKLDQEIQSVRTRRYIFLDTFMLNKSPSRKQLVVSNMRRRRSLGKIDDAKPIRYQASAQE